MSYITSVEQIGYDRGLEQGKRSLLLQILIYKLKNDQKRWEKKKHVV